MLRCLRLFPSWRGAARSSRGRAPAPARRRRRRPRRTSKSAHEGARGLIPGGGARRRGARSLAGAAPNGAIPSPGVSQGANASASTGISSPLRRRGALLRVPHEQRSRAGRATPRPSRSASSCARTARSCLSQRPARRPTGARPGRRSIGGSAQPPAALGRPRVRIDIGQEKGRIQIHFPTDPSPRASAGPELPDTRVDVLAARSADRGHRVVYRHGRAADVRGRAGITHSWMDPRESERSPRWSLLRARRRARPSISALRGARARRPARVELTSERDGKPILNVTRDHHFPRG